uniref:PAP2_C domain-containing protein n=1 Tax=Heterorhabditis bacteriophora TaxID=37862 RepID=A0A1I7WEY1_HETBA
MGNSDSGEAVCLYRSIMEKFRWYLLQQCPVVFDDKCDDQAVFDPRRVFKYRCLPGFPFNDKENIVEVINASTMLSMLQYRDIYRRSWCMIRLNSRYGVSGTPTVMIWVNGVGIARMEDRPLTMDGLMAFIYEWTDLQPKFGAIHEKDDPLRIVKNDGYDIFYLSLSIIVVYAGSEMAELVRAEVHVRCETGGGSLQSIRHPTVTLDIEGDTGDDAPLLSDNNQPVRIEIPGEKPTSPHDRFPKERGKALVGLLLIQKVGENATFWRIVVRGLRMVAGVGLNLRGESTLCGDYIYSGHTIVLVVSALFMGEYSPRRWRFLHISDWCSVLSDFSGTLHLRCNSFLFHLYTGVLDLPYNGCSPYFTDDEWLADGAKRVADMIMHRHLDKEEISERLSGVAFALWKAAPVVGKEARETAEKYWQHSLSNIDSNPKHARYLCGTLGSLITRMSKQDSPKDFAKKIENMADVLSKVLFLNYFHPYHYFFLTDCLFIIFTGKLLMHLLFRMSWFLRYASKYHSPCPLFYEYHGTEYIGAAHGLAGILQMALREHDHQLIHWCHGAPGVIYLLLTMWIKYRNEKYLTAALRSGELIWQKGILKKGPGLCHGVSGNGTVIFYLF